MMKTLRYAFARTLPIMAGYLVLGLGFGVLLQSKGYGVGWSLAMSTLIYAGSVTGTLLGSIIPFDTTGIDFSMTALFLVVMVEQWRTGKDHTPALVGLGVSLICLVIFGSSNFLIPSMLGITAALTLLRGPMEKRAQKEEAAHVD